MRALSSSEVDKITTIKVAKIRELSAQEALAICSIGGSTADCVTSQTVTTTVGFTNSTYGYSRTTTTNYAPCGSSSSGGSSTSSSYSTSSASSSSSSSSSDSNGTFYYYAGPDSGYSGNSAGNSSGYGSGYSGYC